MLTRMIDRIGSRRAAQLFIQQWMEAKHLDNKRLAERMERSEATVSKLLSGKMKMTLEYLAEFAHALDVEVNQLFHDPARPTRDELLRGYSSEEITSAIQLIEHTRRLASPGNSGQSDAREPSERGIGGRRATGGKGG